MSGSDAHTVKNLCWAYLRSKLRPEMFRPLRPEVEARLAFRLENPGIPIPDWMPIPEDLGRESGKGHQTRSKRKVITKKVDVAGI